MGLWKHLDQAMTTAALAAGIMVCPALTALGQTGGVEGTLIDGPLGSTPTVSVVSLRVPASAWRHFEKARTAAERHRDAEFDRESARALEIAPRFAAMYLLRARVEEAGSQYQAALASAQAAATVDPGAMWTTVVLAGTYNGTHRYRDALMVLDAKHGFESETWQAKYERARAETGLMDANAAVYWSAMALQSAPAEFLDAHLVRANALVLAHRPVEAIEQMDIYLQSKAPQPHRDAVMAMRDAVKARFAADQQMRERGPILPGSGETASLEIASR